MIKSPGLAIIFSPVLNRCRTRPHRVHPAIPGADPASRALNYHRHTVVKYKKNILFFFIPVRSGPILATARLAISNAAAKDFANAACQPTSPHETPSPPSSLRSNLRFNSPAFFFFFLFTFFFFFFFFWYRSSQVSIGPRLAPGRCVFPCCLVASLVQ